MLTWEYITTLGFYWPFNWNHTCIKIKVIGGHEQYYLYMKHAWTDTPLSYAHMNYRKYLNFRATNSGIENPTNYTGWCAWQQVLLLAKPSLRAISLAPDYNIVG